MSTCTPLHLRRSRSWQRSSTFLGFAPISSPGQASSTRSTASIAGWSWSAPPPATASRPWSPSGWRTSTRRWPGCRSTRATTTPGPSSPRRRRPPDHRPRGSPPAPKPSSTARDSSIRQFGRRLAGRTISRRRRGRSPWSSTTTTSSTTPEIHEGIGRPAAPPAADDARRHRHPDRAAAAAGAAAGARRGPRTGRDGPAVHRATRRSSSSRDSHGLDLTPGEVDALTDRTEGWVAGLQLVGHALRGPSAGARPPLRRGDRAATSVRRGLPLGRDPAAPTGGDAGVPAAHVDPRPVQRRPLRRRGRGRATPPT